MSISKVIGVSVGSGVGLGLGDGLSIGISLGFGLALGLALGLGDASTATADEGKSDASKRIELVRTSFQFAGLGLSPGWRIQLA